jgi:hypothetical protein
VYVTLVPAMTLASEAAALATTGTSQAIGAQVALGIAKVPSGRHLTL